MNELEGLPAPLRRGVVQIQDRAAVRLGEEQPLLGEEPGTRDVRLEEGDVLAGLAEAGADEAAERSRPQDHDLHAGLRAAS